MALQYVTFNDDNLESGKFYFIEVNKDLVPNLHESSTILGQINSNSDNISALLLDVLNLKSQDNDINTIIYDNQARINNLEDRDLVKEFLLGLSLSTIKAYFDNQTEIKVNYGRKEVSNIIVYQKILDEPFEKVYEEITSGINITYHDKYNEDGTINERYVLIKTDTPITGYALIL